MKPVAWMSNGKEFYVQKNYCPDFIPLYTHPAKTLTEEQIGWFAKAYTDRRGKLNIIDFTRAILRKAQEE
jgi:hypothetical protein